MMKTFTKGSFIFTILMTIFSLVIIIVSLNYASEPRNFPLGIGIFALIMGFIALAGEIFPKFMSRFGASLDDVLDIKAPPTGEAKPEKVAEKSVLKGVLIICAWLAGFFIWVFLFGFIITVPLFTIAFLKLRGGISWFRTILVAVILYGVAHGLFDILMRGDLFKGIVFGDIFPPI